MSDTTNKTAEDFIKNDLTAWKESNPNRKIKEVSLRSKTGFVDFIVCAPDRNVLDAIAKYTNDNKPNKVREVLINSCVLAGDKKVLNDVDVEATMLEKITDLLDKVESKEKEL